jgi:hypothetical protein
MASLRDRSTVTLRVLKKCVADKKFAYVVALARAVNALNSAQSLMMSTENRKTPAALRDRMNSLFFASVVRSSDYITGGFSPPERCIPRAYCRDRSNRCIAAAASESAVLM